MYQLSRGLDVAADVRKEAAARGIPKPVIRVPVPRDCPHPLLVPVGVPLREYIRCLQRRLASRPGQTEADRIACDLQKLNSFRRRRGALLDANGWNLSRCLTHYEGDAVEAAMQRAHGNQSESARLLGITPRSVYNKMRKYRTGAKR